MMGCERDAVLFHVMFLKILFFAEGCQGAEGMKYEGWGMNTAHNLFPRS